jgi:hypothetical protein
VFGQITDLVGEERKAAVGVSYERRVAGPVSAFSTTWVEKGISKNNTEWGYGALGGLRMRF